MVALTDSKVYYRTIRDAILTLLRNNRTILNTNLTLGTFSNVNEQIKAGDIMHYPINVTIYPAILILWARKEEEFTHLGHAGRKRPVITYLIYGFVRVPKLSIESNNEIMQLVSNIESIFRDNITINNTVLWADIKRTERQATGLIEQEQYIDGVEIELTCIVEVK